MLRENLSNDSKLFSSMSFTSLYFYPILICAPDAAFLLQEFSTKIHPKRVQSMMKKCRETSNTSWNEIFQHIVESGKSNECLSQYSNLQFSLIIL